ncbi:hypothetical protein M413DRAFT_449348 [Hebeloma cylindrosporum]|uniref:Wax synthase domain-containing protein n=1 Tax=Hebeloma cylindrosporum TaxID=76867 RepID=A0A0C2XE27_HEBCY|nr:hypothetical protein M413DRAFT_449348 [Hebeloma cylindrosporum h7]
MEDRKPFSPALFSFIIPIIVLSLVVQPTRYRPILFLPVLGIAYYQVFYTTTGHALTDLSLASSITPYVATAFDFIILTEPQTQLFQLGQKIPSASYSTLWAKIKWALDLLFSQRGIGWIHEPSAKLPPPPFAAHASRVKFIAHQLATALVYFLMWDVCAIYARSTPVFMLGDPPLSEQPFLRKCINTWAWAIPATAALAINHSLLSAVMVGLGIWPISQWRPLFGDWKEAYTVRRLWSRTWHQLLRRVLTSPGQKLRQYLSIPKGSWLSSYTLLYTSFFLSALIHHTADYMMLGRYGGALKFFLSQAFFITIEDSIIALGGRIGFTESFPWRILGYLWVQLWFAYSLPWWIQPEIAAGMMRDGMGYSLILGFWNGNWAPGQVIQEGV